MSTTSSKTDSNQPQELGVKDLAKRLKTDPRDLRKWLRAEGHGLGHRGKRYAFTPDEAKTLAAAWRKAQKEAGDS
jgi:phage antirepressor YoqD-like protein